MAKPIGPRLHGVLDYLAVLLLFAAGPLVGFDGIASQITSTLAGVVLVYSAATAYPYSIIKMIPLRAHLVIDALVGSLMIASPWAFRFSDIAPACYFFVGYGVSALIVVALSSRT